MKRITSLWLGGALMAALAGSLAAGQNNDNLGDYARQVRKQKAQAAPAVKTFDNDNLPKVDKLSVVGQAPPADETAPADATANDEQQAGTEGAPATAADAKAPAQPKENANGDAAQEEQAAKQKMYKEWQGKIHEQRDKIDLMTRELDVANREYRLRAASFYADAGNRLRNSAAWDKEDAQYKDQIAAKQKALDDAKAALDDMQEQARKAGVPSSMRD
jgi:hypothetical protein